MEPQSSQTIAWRQRVRDPALTMILVVQCLIVFVVAPLAATGDRGSRVALEALFLVFGFLIVFVSRNAVTTAIAACAVVVSLSGVALSFLEPATHYLALAQTGIVGGGIVAAYVVGRAVFAPGAVTAHRVFGAVVLYLTFGLIFTAAYRLVWDLAPNALSGIPRDAAPWQASGSILYFSFVTLSSIGFGDIVPVHPFARSLSNLEGIIGQLYPATLLARLVTLQLETRRRHSDSQ